MLGRDIIKNTTYIGLTNMGAGKNGKRCQNEFLLFSTVDTDCQWFFYKNLWPLEVNFEIATCPNMPLRGYLSNLMPISNQCQPVLYSFCIDLIFNAFSLTNFLLYTIKTREENSTEEKVLAFRVDTAVVIPFEQLTHLIQIIFEWQHNIEVLQE